MVSVARDMSANGARIYRVFFEELSRLGYVEGQNLGVERYSGEGRTEHYAELARDVVNTHPDLMLAVGGRLSLDFKMATTTIPIVTIIIDPIAMGLVTSIARPGSNITGATIAGGLEVIGKRMGLLVEATPKLSTVGYLAATILGGCERCGSARGGQKVGGLRCRLLCWAPLLTRQSTSASLGRFNKTGRMRSWYLKNPSTSPIVL